MPRFRTLHHFDLRPDDVALRLRLRTSLSARLDQISTQRYCVQLILHPSLQRCRAPAFPTAELHSSLPQCYSSYEMSRADVAAKHSDEIRRLFTILLVSIGRQGQKINRCSHAKKCYAKTLTDSRLFARCSHGSFRSEFNCSRRKKLRAPAASSPCPCCFAIARSFLVLRHAAGSARS